MARFENGRSSGVLQVWIRRRQWFAVVNQVKVAEGNTSQWEWRMSGGVAKVSEGDCGRVGGCVFVLHVQQLLIKDPPPSCILAAGDWLKLCFLLPPETSFTSSSLSQLENTSTNNDCFHSLPCLLCEKLLQYIIHNTNTPAAVHIMLKTANVASSRDDVWATEVCSLHHSTPPNMFVFSVKAAVVRDILYL